MKLLVHITPEQFTTLGNLPPLLEDAFVAAAHANDDEAQLLGLSFKIALLNQNGSARQRNPHDTTKW